MKKQVKIVLLVALIAVLALMTAMFASAATTTVPADGDLAAAITAAAAGDTITLEGDVTLAAGVTLDKDITIDGAGHKITFTAGTAIGADVNVNGAKITSGYAINASAGNIVLKNVTVVAPNDGTSKTAVLYLSGEANVTLDSFVSDGGYMGIVFNANASVEMKGESNIGANNGHQYLLGGSDTATGGSFKLTSGIIKQGKTTGDMLVVGGKGFNFEIAGGDVYAQGDCIYFVGSGHTITISGGKVSGTANVLTPNCADSTINVTGGHIIAEAGKFAVNVRNNSVYNFSDNAWVSGTFNCGGTATLNIYGGTYDKASNSHGRGASIIFSNGGDAITNIYGGTFTLESGKGDNIICQNDTGTHINVYGGTFQILGTDNAAKAVYISNGFVTIAGGTFSSEGTGNLIEDVNTATVEDIVIDNTDGNLSITHTGSGSIIYLTSSKPVTIKNWTYTYEGSQRLVYIGGNVTMMMEECYLTAAGSPLELSESSAAVVTVNGGAFTSTAGKAITASATSSVTCMGGCELFGAVESDNVVNVSEPVIKVDGVEYLKLKTALAAIKDGSRVTILLGDTALVLETDKRYTLNAESGLTLGSITITGGTVTLQTIKSNGTLTISGNARVTMRGGTMTEGVNTKIVVKDSANLTISSGKYTSGAANVVVFSSTGKLTINGGTFTRTDSSGAAIEISKGTAVIGGNTTLSGYRAILASNCNLTIDGGTFVHNNVDQDNTNLIANNGGSTIVINDGTFESNGYLIYMNNKGTMTINGGTFTTLDEGRQEESPNVDGMIYLSDGGAVLTINGGTFTHCGTYAMIEKKNGRLEINGGTFTNNGTGAVLSIVSNSATAANKGVSISNCTLIGEIIITMADGLTGEFAINNVIAIDTSAEANGLIAEGVTVGKDIIILAKSAEAPMTEASAKAMYAGAEYYVWMKSAGAEANLPTMETGAGARLGETTADSGIRFTSSITKSIIEALGGTIGADGKVTGVVLGTLIAPADYVAAAGGFTHADLVLYAAAAGKDASAIYADVVASNSVQVSEDSVNFNAALVNIKAENYDRVFAAVAYIKDASGNYYYADYDSVANARSIKQIITEARADIVTEAPEEPYFTAVVADVTYYSKKYDEYSIEKIVALDAVVNPVA